MTHANVEKLMAIFGRTARAVEVKEDHFEIRFPIGGPGAEVATIDECGIYVDSSPADREAFEANETDVCPQVFACEYCDLDDPEIGGSVWFKNLARGIQGTPWHSGGNTWHTMWSRPDGKLVVFCADGIALYESRDAWHNTDGEDHLWIDYSAMAPGGPSTPSDETEVEETERLDRQRWVEILEERRHDLDCVVETALSESYHNTGSEGEQRIRDTIDEGAHAAVQAVEEEFSLCPMGQPEWDAVVEASARSLDTWNRTHCVHCGCRMDEAPVARPCDSCEATL